MVLLGGKTLWAPLLVRLPHQPRTRTADPPYSLMAGIDRYAAGAPAGTAGRAQLVYNQ